MIVNCIIIFIVYDSYLFLANTSSHDVLLVFKQIMTWIFVTVLACDESSCDDISTPLPQCSSR